MGLHLCAFETAFCHLDQHEAPAFLEIARRQMLVEGGYQGRTHKLVDACYSFWQGSTPAMLFLASNGTLSASKHLQMKMKVQVKRDEGNSVLNRGDLLCDQIALQRYILLCCQPSSTMVV